jgi:hypothetical protein
MIAVDSCPMNGAARWISTGPREARPISCREAELIAAVNPMPAGRARRLRLTLTVGQMMKLVVFGAAASLCLLPMQPLLEEGVVTWQTALLWESAAIPLSQAVAAFALVKPGRFRDGLILTLVVTALLTAPGVVLYYLTWGAASAGGVTPGFLLLVLALLLGPLLTVLLYILPRPCPRCPRSWLLLDGTFRPGPRSLLRRAYRCDSCKERYWKDRGAWSTVPPSAG